MTNQPKRYLTDQDLDKIADLWRRYRSLKTLAGTALPPTAEGAWIYEAATRQMAMVVADLEAIFEETYPWLPDEVDE